MLLGSSNKDSFHVMIRKLVVVGFVVGSIF